MAEHDDTSLQFEQAEYDEPEAARLSCGSCQTELYDTYFEVNGQPTCERCRWAVEESLSTGSGTGRFAQSLLAGSAAGAVGAALFYGVAALTGYSFGLIAIVVGLLVGFAVRWGCNGRGGWFYQGLAMLLTYVAIVSTYIPGIIEALRDEYRTQEEVAAETVGQVEEVAADLSPGAAPQEKLPPDDTAEPASVSNDEISEEEITIGLRLFAYAAVLLLAMAAPILMAFESPIGLVIIGIGLYEAWKINKKLVLEVTGPFQVKHWGAADELQSAAQAIDE